jgi:branched-chain amino acid transport system permease protein
LLESFGALAFGSQWSATVGFAVMLVILVVKPTGIVGKSGFE